MLDLDVLDAVVNAFLHDMPFTKQNIVKLRMLNCTCKAIRTGIDQYVMQCEKFRGFYKDFNNDWLVLRSASYLRTRTVFTFSSISIARSGWTTVVISTTLTPSACFAPQPSWDPLVRSRLLRAAAGTWLIKKVSARGCMLAPHLDFADTKNAK